MERRAASIHVHVDGETGPAITDVISGCLRTLSSLLQHANGWQLGQIIRALADNLDELKGWERLDQCRWLAGKICEWTQYQYRYAVPTRLVEHLLESQDATSTTALQSSLAAMATTIFTSPTPLINLSTSDIISNLIQLVMHRIAVNSEDSLLPDLVECIASLGMHIYYSDQIQDLAGELISRLVNVEIQGVPGSSSENSKQNRSQAIRCLLAGLLGLVQAADKDGRVHGDSDSVAKAAASPATPSIGTAGNQDPHSRPSRRTRVSPEVWLDTLSLLCDVNYAVRADYADAFVFYLRNEIRKRGDSADPDGVKRIRPLAEGPIQQATRMKLLTHGDPATRALHAAHGYIYVLATAASLGFDPSTRASSAATAQTHNPSINTQSTSLIEEMSNNDTSDNRDSRTQSQRQARRSTFSTPRKASVMQRALEAAPSKVSTATAATLSDYAHILVVLTTIQEQLPVRGLLTGIPMLLALDGATQVTNSIDYDTIQRLYTIKEVIARVWGVIGKVWGCSELTTLSEEALAGLPGQCNLTSVSTNQKTSLSINPEPVLFNPGETKSKSSWSGISSQNALMTIVSSQSVQEATGLDRPGLLRRFSMKWTAESALKDSVEQPSNYDTLRGDGISPLLKISPALMNIDNISLHSLARSTRGVGVTDLREALEGRMSMSSATLAKAASISTLDHATPTGDHFQHVQKSARPVTTSSAKRRKSNANGADDVRDVLKKLGLGKQNGSSLLKASFPPVQKSEQRLSSNPLPGPDL
ncbi:hypothetical protein FIBSPDRAFT_1055768 [Athelia psychrophila]|uniref:Protein EFR3 n=1 Tax=Athelia psychrophila TaxID=1759441 RepID=A0A167T603_9AGAM|nr:hypothetical protein FIBSPDRAFT_1055768 [Fibularhizoctonia sp. CBS 109695]